MQVKNSGEEGVPRALSKSRLTFPGCLPQLPRDAILVNLTQLRNEYIADLKADTLRARTLLEKFVEKTLQPGDCSFRVACFLDISEHLGKHKSQEGQELVNPKVVHLVPVLVQDVEAGLEPLLLPLSIFYSLHDFADLKRGFSLVHRLVRMPKHYI